MLHINLLITISVAWLAYTTCNIVSLFFNVGGISQASAIVIICIVARYRTDSTCPVARVTGGSHSVIAHRVLLHLNVILLSAIVPNLDCLSSL